MNKKVLIIGAGPSGIAAASKLYENGFKNVTVLEAENRFGGRVHTIPFALNVVDMGAQWCHGEVGNCVFEMANKYGLFSSISIKKHQLPLIRSNGEPVDNTIAQKLSELGDSISEDNDELKKVTGSVGTFVEERFVFIENIYT